jgi:hypothetical protein
MGKTALDKFQDMLGEKGVVIYEPSRVDKVNAAYDYLRAIPANAVEIIEELVGALKIYADKSSWREMRMPYPMEEFFSHWDWSRKDGPKAIAEQALQLAREAGIGGEEEAHHG